MKYSENDYDERHAECPARMSISHLATRFQRDHEWLAQAVLPEGNGSIERSPKQVERGRQAT
jgi:hypothetical protein